MKWALVTLLLGYIAIWRYNDISLYLVPISFVITLIFSIYLVSKRIRGLPSITQKIRAFGWVLLFTVLVTVIIYYSIQARWISIWIYPPIFAAMVLLREVFRKLIELTISEPKSFGVLSQTHRGETVRSKAEKKVADWLYEKDIEYEYERRIEISGEKPVLTDFYLPELDIYIEYWGLASADNEVGEQYRERKQEKLEFYRSYNYKLISIYPHHLFELDDYIPQQIQELTSSGGFWIWVKNLFGLSKTNDQLEDTTMFCTNCGSEVTSVGEFCINCGQEVL